LRHKRCACFQTRSTHPARRSVVQVWRAKARVLVCPSGAAVENRDKVLAGGKGAYGGTYSCLLPTFQ
jgi:hypothetical protein